MKKRLALLLVSSLIVGMFTACGTKPVSSGSQPAASSTPEAAGGVSGKITVSMDQQLKSSFPAIVAAFNELYPDVEVEVLYGKEQDALVAAGQAPDILKTGDLLIASMQDQLLDLTDLIERDKAEVNPDDYYAGVLDTMKLDGRQYAMPVSFTIALLYYNTDLFDAANLEYPTNEWTHDDFIQAGQALTLTENGKPTQWGASTVLGWWGEWLIYVRQNGGDWMVDDRCVLDTPEAAAGVQFYFDKTTKGEYKISPSPSDDSFGGFAGGKVAMEVGGHTGNWVSFNELGTLNYDIQVIPKSAAGYKGAESTIEAYGIYSGSKNPEAAFAFLKFWTGTEGGKMYMESSSRPVPRKSVAEATMAVPVEQRPAPRNLEALYSALENDVVFACRDPLFESTQQQVVQPYIDQILEGKLGVEAGLKEAAKSANDYLDLNR